MIGSLSATDGFLFPKLHMFSLTETQTAQQTRVVQSERKEEHRMGTPVHTINSFADVIQVHGRGLIYKHGIFMAIYIRNCTQLRDTPLHSEDV